MQIWGRSIKFEKRVAPNLNLCNFPVFDDKWEEVNQRKNIKSSYFYEEQAKSKRYFYYIDLQGRLFLEDIVPKNVATSLKSEKFLKFFYRQLKKNSSVEFSEYPYVSPCGAEINFIRPADTPFVFTELLDDSLLVCGGGNFKQKFCKQSLLMSRATNRLYHPFANSEVSMNALISSHLSISLSERFEFDQVSNSFFFFDYINSEKYLIREF